MRKFFVGIVMASVATIGFGSVAFASYNQPPTAASVCDSGHGVFGAFSPYKGGTGSNDVPGQPPYFGDQTLGSATGGATGAVNSDYSASCNS